MRQHCAGALALVIASFSLGCVVEAPPPPVAVAPQPEVYVEAIPPLPPPRNEVVVVRPSPAHVWVAGHWAWRAPNRAYAWIPGHWVVPANPRHVWVPGHWQARRGGYVWIEGHWR